MAQGAFAAQSPRTAPESDTAILLDEQLMKLARQLDECMYQLEERDEIIGFHRAKYVKLAAKCDLLQDRADAAMTVLGRITEKNIALSEENQALRSALQLWQLSSSSSPESSSSQPSPPPPRSAAELEQLQALHESLKAELESSCRQQAEERSRHAAEVGPLRQQLAALEAEVAQMGPQLCKQAAEVAPLRTRLVEAERQAAAVGPLQLQLEEARKQVQRTEKSVETAASERDTYKEDLRIEKRKYGSLMVQKVTADEEKEEAKAQLAALLDPCFEFAVARELVPCVDVAMLVAEQKLEELAKQVTQLTSQLAAAS